MKNFSLEQINWQKMNGLLPAIIQNTNNGAVLMLGYMNREALEKTLDNKIVTFFSRSKQRLWIKGETSGHVLKLQSIALDCDGDSLLLQVIPTGPTCHLGYKSCFQPSGKTQLQFLDELIELIKERSVANVADSYTAQLLSQGKPRCAQKVGEEAVETVIAALSEKQDNLINEASDLFYHLLVLLKACELSFYDLLTCLEQRHQMKKSSAVK